MSYCCPKCGKQLSVSDVEDYPFVCHECDENFYQFEAIWTDGKGGNVSKYEEPMMEKKTIEVLWEAFGDCNRDDDDCIDSPFCGWECGTNVHEIWHWFDEQYARWGGVHALMFPDEHNGMHYYEFMFFGSDKLFDEGWHLIEDWEEDNVLSQSFYGKSEKPLESIKQAKKYLRETFPVTSEYDVNLVNCLDEHTVGQLAHYFEIDATEFEISCGCKA